MNVKKIVLGLAVGAACAAPALLAVGDEGYPTPVVGPCNWNGMPSQREIHLFEHNDFLGRCWKLTLPLEHGYARIRNVAELGIPNDLISSARVGADITLDMWEHHFWGGRWAGIKGPVSPNWNPTQDNDFRNFNPVSGFNDKLTSLAMTFTPF